MNLCFPGLKRHSDGFNDVNLKRNSDGFLDIRVHGFLLNGMLDVFNAVSFYSRLISALFYFVLAHIILTERVSLQVFSSWFSLACDLILKIFERRRTYSHDCKHLIDEYRQNQDATDNPSNQKTKICDFCLIKYFGVQEIREQ